MKKLWDKLAKTNSKYYINSDKGRGITEEEFRYSGEIDYDDYIYSDHDFLFERFIRTRSSTCLEIGCGTGRMTEFISRDFRYVVGIDISGEMIKQAKQRLEKLNNLALIETDGKTIPLKDNSIDFVFL